MASTDSRRNASGESRNARVIVRGGPLKLYFCAADETKFAGTGGEGTVTTAASPYADIIALLQVGGLRVAHHGMWNWVGGGGGGAVDCGKAGGNAFLLLEGRGVRRRKHVLP